MPAPHTVRAIRLECGPDQVEAAVLTPMPQVRAHYPDLPDTGAAGFSAYLACKPFTPVMLCIDTDAGVSRQPLTLRPRDDAAADDASPTVERFLQAMKDRAATVMELGARDVGSMTQGWRSRFEPACRYIGNDIHPGPGIDAVGDVHSLTQFVEPHSLDGLFSVAVLEHLAAPWIAAVEINRALRIGGETMHVTHQTWPLHETPNDFFRMSDQALKSLFGPATGFEVVECGMAYPVSIVPPPPMRHSAWLWVPVGRGYGQSYIRARKIADLEPGAACWNPAGLVATSQAYPAPR